MKRGDIVSAAVTIIKVKRDVPTVVMISGRRYVLDPNTKTKEAERK